MKIKFIIFLMIPILIFSKTPKNPEKDYVSAEEKKMFHKEFLEILSRPTSDMDKLYEKGEDMLKVSKTDEETARSYFVMGDAMQKQMKYARAINYFNKADYYAGKSNFYNEQFLTNLILSDIYGIVGLNANSENALAIAKKITTKFSGVEYGDMMSMLNYQKSKILKRKKKYCEAVDYENKMTQYSKQKLQNDSTGNNKYNYQARICNLAYTLLKCGKIDKAKIVIDEFEKNYNASSDYNQSYVLEFYYLSKAILSYNENNRKAAKIWFDRAIERAKERKKNTSLTTIMEERLSYNIDDNQSEKQYYEEYLSLYRESQQEAIEIYKKEINSQEKSATKEKKSVKILSISSAILAAGIFIILYYSNRRSKQVKTHFEDIIKNIEWQNLQRYKEIKEVDISMNPIIDNKTYEKRQKLISSTREVLLLQKLEEFESGKEFTSFNFTASNLASILDTNIKYTNYILKEHRKKNFNEYINGLRINFLTNLLYKEPQHLNFKINYLSELAGFSSHSYFTQVFKKELNISPSEFISQLSQKQLPNK